MKRNIFSKLAAWKQAKPRKPLIVRGARQVGKTYSLRAFCKDAFHQTHYFNFEKDETLAKVFEKDLNPSRILQELSFYSNAKIDKTRDVLIFDEIQHTPRALTSLKYFHEEIPQLAICAAGSLLGIHLGRSSFPVGKVEFLDMVPLSFGEFLDAVNDQRSLEAIEKCRKTQTLPDIIHHHLWDQFKIYLVTGGLPEVVQTYLDHQEDLFSALQKVRQKQTDLITAYVADMAKHAGKQNAMHLERLWRNVPMQLAQMQDDESVHRFRFKDVIPGVNRYTKLVGAIDWITAAELVIKTYVIEHANVPLLAHTKENFFKLYLFDVGMLGALSHLAPKIILEADYGSYKGFVAENFVAQAFVAQGAAPLFCWSEKNAEVEFLRDIDGAIIPIEVKSGNVTQAKSLKVFVEKYRPPYRVVMSGRNLMIDHVNKVHHYPLYLASYFPF